jgi:hypothetical protein
MAFALQQLREHAGQFPVVVDDEYVAAHGLMVPRFRLDCQRRRFALTLLCATSWKLVTPLGSKRR